MPVPDTAVNYGELVNTSCTDSRKSTQGKNINSTYSAAFGAAGEDAPALGLAGVHASALGDAGAGAAALRAA